MPNDEFLNAEDAAKVLHVGRNAVYALAKSGDLPSYKMGRKMLFSLKDLQTFLEAKRTAPSSNDPVRSTASSAPAPFNEAAVNDDGTFIISGHGISTNILVDRLQTLGMKARRVPRNSYDGLVAMYNQRSHAALLHLYDQRTNTYNIPYVQRLLPGESVTVFRLMKRKQGFVTAQGNPKSISSWGALLRSNTRLANRKRGCGSRILMDEKLLSMGADASVINGYESCYDTGLAAADAVARGFADVAVAGEQIAAQIDGVDFVPMQSEWLDLVVSKNGIGRDLCFALKSFFADKSFKREFGRVVHGDDECLGAIVYES